MNPACQEPVYIIIPVHNRKNITLKCLENLNQQGSLQRYHVVVVDDGSTDGTTEAIYSLYPEVTVLAGDGNLWWTGAIKKGMKYAISQEAEYLIWLNDDCYPKKGAIEKLLNVCKNNPLVIAGCQSLEPDTCHPSYGGIVCQNNHILPVYASDNSDFECDGLNGNLVCIPKKVIEVIGYPNDKLFPQYHGDTTYTHLAKKRGYKLLICNESVAFCKNDHPHVSWVTPDRPLLEFWREYFRIKSAFYWKAEFAYYREMLGIPGIWIYFYERILKFWLIAAFISPLPLKYRVKLKEIFKKLKAIKLKTIFH
ncbi:MAG: glycosyltransferase family 2 protein [Xenococcaceae cyanobacterium]